MSEITIRVPAELQRRLAGAFGANGALSPEQTARIAETALEQWTMLLLGPHRPRSLSELLTGWIGAFFPRLLPGEDPDQRGLVRRFALPFGQAGYIARVLRDSQPALRRREWLLRLDQELQRNAPRAAAWTAAGRGDEVIEVTLHVNARRELNLLVDSIVGDQPQITFPRRAGQSSDYVRLLIAAADFPVLLAALARELELLGGGAEA